MALSAQGIRNGMGKRTALLYEEALHAEDRCIYSPSFRAAPFDSITSAAESFRSTCASERRPPECSMQRCPAATPQVGQGIDNSCSGVRSLFRIGRECGKK